MTTPMAPMGPRPTAPGPTAAGTGPSDKIPTKKNQRVYAIAGVVLALLAAVLVFGASGEKTDGSFVFVAKQPVAALATLNAASFEAVAVPEELQVKGAITAESAEALAELVDFDGTVAQYPIEEGAQLTESMLTVDAQIGVTLEEGERLMSIEADVSEAAAGALRPGDTVDVYAVGTSPDLSIAQLALAKVEIVSVSLSPDSYSKVVQDQLEAAGEGGEQKDPSEVLPARPVPGMYTVKVLAQHVTRLAVLDANDTVSLYLVYRAPNSADVDVSEVPADLLTTMCGFPAVNDPAAPAPEGIPAELPQACIAAFNQAG